MTIFFAIIMFWYSYRPVEVPRWDWLCVERTRRRRYSKFEGTQVWRQRLTLCINKNNNNRVAVKFRARILCKKKSVLESGHLSSPEIHCRKNEVTERKVFDPFTPKNDSPKLKYFDWIFRLNRDPLLFTILNTQLRLEITRIISYFLMLYYVSGSILRHFYDL